VVCSLSPRLLALWWCSRTALSPLNVTDPAGPGDSLELASIKAKILRQHNLVAHPSSPSSQQTRRTKVSEVAEDVEAAEGWVRYAGFPPDSLPFGSFAQVGSTNYESLGSVLTVVVSPALHTALRLPLRWTTPYPPGSSSRFWYSRKMARCYSYGLCSSSPSEKLACRR